MNSNTMKLNLNPGLMYVSGLNHNKYWTDHNVIKRLSDDKPIGYISRGNVYLYTVGAGSLRLPKFRLEAFEMSPVH